MFECGEQGDIVLDKFINFGENWKIWFSIFEAVPRINGQKWCFDARFVQGFISTKVSNSLIVRLLSVVLRVFLYLVDSEIMLLDSKVILCHRMENGILDHKQYIPPRS